VSVWGGESIHDAVRSVGKNVAPPNRAVKFTVDLAAARTDKSLMDEGLLPSGKTFLYLTVLQVGSGVWTVKLVFDDFSTLAYDVSELHDGYLMVRRFVDLLFTNMSQPSVTNPKLLVEWNE
jgi:hypothetical protein